MKNNEPFTFLEYNMNQLFLPSDLTDWITEDHIARLINEVVDQIDDAILNAAYSGGGRSAYHPKMMLKVTLYAYTQKVTSGRRIAKMCQEDIPTIWLSSRQTPDFRTINRFRTGRLMPVIEAVFTKIVEQLATHGLVNPKIYYVDGTKIEANANKYSFVWTRATKRFSSQLEKNLENFFVEAQQIATIENENAQAPQSVSDLKKLSESILESIHDESSSLSLTEWIAMSQKMEQQLQTVEQDLSDKSRDKKAFRQTRRMRKKLCRDYLPRLNKYQKHLSIAGTRNSFSKTDRDATFMRMKEDPMKNGQLKAGYNVQIGTNNQYILAYTIHPNPTDTLTLKPHLEHVHETTNFRPELIIADAGYGSQENYEYLESKDLEALIPYTMFRKDAKKRHKFDVSNWHTWTYDTEKDQFTCPAGQEIPYLWTRYEKDRYGQKREISVYGRKTCVSCPLKAQCTKAKEARHLYINRKFEKYKETVCQKLLNEPKAMMLYAQRKMEPESVFGNLKQNLGFRRFVLRGKDKVNVEFGLQALAHNMIKWSKAKRNA